MLIDHDTLIALDLCESTSRGIQLSPWINATHTPGGADALMHMLMEPLANAASITARQRDVERLCGLQFPLKSFAGAIVGVTRYINSNFSVFPSSPVRCFWEAHFFHDYAADVAGGLIAVAELSRLLEPVETQLAAAVGTKTDSEAEAANPNGLWSVLQRIRAFRHSNGAMRLHSVTKRPGGVVSARLLSIDGNFRGTKQPLLRDVLEALTHLDALCALAALATRPGFSLPAILPRESRQVHLDGLFHPRLRRAVHNDVAFSGDAPVLILTGPNMAGKSTLLRSVGVALILAHVGAPVPSKHASMALCDRLFVAISTNDDLVRGESLFLAEVRRIKQLVSALVQNTYVFALIDEPFRGTNILDAMDATSLLIDGLIHARTGIGIVATHLVDVAHRFQETASATFACFAADESSPTIAFDYRLSPGVSAQRLGGRILEQEGVVAAIATLRSGAH